MDIAIEKESMEVVELLWEAIGEEIPDKVKLQQLSKEMYKEDTEKAKKKFSELLRSLTPELVRYPFHLLYIGCISFLQVSTTTVNRFGSVLQAAAFDGKTEFVRILLEYR